jgi:ADP-ribose pyrophosphatase YjhB (NUDIX family)
MIALVAKLWRRLDGIWHWYALWLINSKFIVGVSGIVLNERGEILLLRHRFWREGSWGLPGGYVKRRERLEDALAREVREETGYQIEPVALVRLVSGYKLRLEASFLARLDGGELRIDPHEVLEARFFLPDRLPDGLLRSHQAVIALALSSGLVSATPTSAG